MWWKNLSEERRRVGFALTVTLAAHGAAFYLLVIDSRTYRRPLPTGEPRILPITIFLPDVQDEKPLSKRARRPTPASAQVDIHTVPISDSTQLTTSEASLLSALDWHEQGAQAAGAAVGRSINSTGRSLDSQPTTIPKPEVYEKGLFDLGPAHKPGTVEDHGDGLAVTWVSAYCYRISSMTFEGRVDSVGCAQSKASEGGADLFEELKPSYLRTPLEPAAPVAREPQ